MTPRQTADAALEEKSLSAGRAVGYYWERNPHGQGRCTLPLAWERTPGRVRPHYVAVGPGPSADGVPGTGRAAAFVPCGGGHSAHEADERGVEGVGDAEQGVQRVLTPCPARSR